MQFIDAHNFDVRSIKKSCVHIVDKDNKIIPFETMNLFYRDEKKERLEKEEQKYFEGSKEPISYNQITNSKLYLLKEEVDFLKKVIVTLKETKV